MKKPKIYELVVYKDDDYSPDEIQEWIDSEVGNKWTKRDYKKKVTYWFHDLDDAFKFKLHWTKA